LYQFVNFNLTLVICIKYAFIEMLDKFITYKNVHGALLQAIYTCSVIAMI
jgi:hypothetical protein